MVKCITCGIEFESTKSKGNQYYKNCESCRRSLVSAGHSGGATTKARHGQDYYNNIGKMGGSKVKELIAAGKRAEALRDDHK